MKWTRWGIAFALLLMMSATAFAQDAQTPEALCEAANTDEPETRAYEQAEDVLEEGVDYRAIICTEAGPIYVNLFENVAPITVNNFVFLAEEGYYNNTTFHRVLDNFMAQGGDPTGSGAGGPGYQFEDEFVGFLTFDRPGLLAMANAGPGTNGSQFFITYAETPHLNYAHTIFGEVLSGQENANALTRRNPTPEQTPDFEGDALNTVLIVTDPATVDTEVDVEMAEPATGEDIVAAFEELPAIAEQNGLTFNEEASGLRTAEEVVAATSEDAQDNLNALLDEQGFDYRYQAQLDNEACDPQFGFDYLTYTINAYEDAQAAETVLTGDALAEVLSAEGFERVEENESGLAQYVMDSTDCAEADAVTTRVYMQRGRYVVSVESRLPVELAEQYPTDRILGEQFARIFEQFLAGAFRSVVQ